MAEADWLISQRRAVQVLSQLVKRYQGQPLTYGARAYERLNLVSLCLNSLWAWFSDVISSHDWPIKKGTKSH